MEEYNIFLSWSKPLSKAVAEVLHHWLPLAIQGAKPWMSATDIPKGIPWFGEIADQLKGIQIGIICVTPENLASPSIHFEAGALSKVVSEKAYVCPYLFDVPDTDLGFPLAQFQATKARDQKDTRSLFHTLDRALKTTSLTKEQLDTVFDKWWDDLERALKSVRPLDSGKQQTHRTDRDILEELLRLVRFLFVGVEPQDIVQIKKELFPLSMGGQAFEPSTRRSEAAARVLSGGTSHKATGPPSAHGGGTKSGKTTEPE